MISGTGALERTERLIDELASESSAALARLDLDPRVRAALESLADAAVRRTA